MSKSHFSSNQKLIIPMLLCVIGLATPLYATAKANQSAQATLLQEPAGNADSATWFKWHEQQAKLGNLKSLWMLGSHYCAGSGVKKDEARGRELMLEAAEKGDAFAQVMFGNRQTYGRCGLEKDEKAGFAWTLKAAEQGDAEAQYDVARAYRVGDGVEKDIAQAVYWYSKSADQGNISAKDDLAILHVKGDGVALDHQAALRLFRENVAKKSLSSQMFLGKAYSVGALRDGDRLLTPKSLVVAYALYSAQQDPNEKLHIINLAKEDREKLAVEMTPMQLWAAKHLAKKMQSSGDTLKVLDAYMEYERPWAERKSKKLSADDQMAAAIKESNEAVAKGREYVKSFLSGASAASDKPSDELAGKSLRTGAERAMLTGMKITNYQRDNGWLESQVPMSYRVVYTYDYELTKDLPDAIIEAAENMLKDIPKEFAGDFMGIGFTQVKLNTQLWKSKQGDSFDYRHTALLANCGSCADYWWKDRPKAEKENLETAFLASWLLYSDLGFHDAASVGDKAPRKSSMSFIKKERGWDPVW